MGEQGAENRMALMTVFHGGCQAVEKPEIRRTDRYTMDFGTGFYCSVIREQAQRRARRYPAKTVSIYDVRFHDGLRIFEFRTMTDEWLDFIAECRSGKKHDYDIVIGPMVDDQNFSCVSDYLDGSVTKEQFRILARFRYPTHQIAFCTDDSLKCLTYRGFEIV